jgi:hypothetical protein
MAIIFELYAECLTKEKAAQLVTHFDGLEFDLCTGRSVHWTATQETIGAQIFVVEVYSSDLSRYGVRSVQDAVESTESGLRLYYHLQNCLVFELARVGWDVDCVTMLDLVEWIEPMGNTGESHCRIQCAVSNSLYEQIGKPKFFKEFAPGYMWNTYTGEKYQPLFSNDQPVLDAIARDLFDWSS